MQLAIEVRKLVKTYPGRPPVEAVRGIDLTVEVGQCYGFLGPNGAGKTTTIEILEGLMSATSGSIRLLDLDWRSNQRQLRQRIGVSLQETKMSDNLTVLETVKLFRSFYNSGISAEDAIQKVSLLEKSKARVKTLSGGQRQRLAIACAIVGSPQLLFLDEPTTGLDPASRRQLWDIIRGFREAGQTILLTTHYMEEAERLCDRVAIIDQGRIIAEGTPPELIRGLGAEHVIEIPLETMKKAIEASAVSGLPTVQQVEVQDNCLRIAVGQPHLALPKLLDALSSRGLEMTGLSIRHATLEDVFISLTGRNIDNGSANGAPTRIVNSGSTSLN
ncbi:MAG TPA: ABC transporter ATP-binding protein [Pirellulaceae bacterium]|nr:ABC transporter ATP-binding protein [Pirellulaceae bacterium]HMO90617.1 ABC transporter ATP-binding protein [Pirellulaceae bacterium]HMP67804.1 ABC transporter ATP-binding protein [Pirellulaceae bacterium]